MRHQHPHRGAGKESCRLRNTSGRVLDKFKKFRLTPLPAARVAAPLISECYASLECKVIDASMVDKYCLFVLEVVKAWIDRAKKSPRTIHHCGRGVFMVGDASSNCLQK